MRRVQAQPGSATLSIRQLSQEEHSGGALEELLAMLASGSASAEDEIQAQCSGSDEDDDADAESPVASCSFLDAWASSEAAAYCSYLDNFLSQVRPSACLLPVFVVRALSSGPVCIRGYSRHAARRLLHKVAAHVTKSCAILCSPVHARTCQETVSAWQQQQPAPGWCM